MKVFVSAYLRKNFGDDLFVYILSQRYPNIKFYALSTMNYSLGLENFKVICIRNKLLELINFIVFRKEKNNNFQNFLMSKFMFSILIGGSMFIENNNTTNPVYFGGGKDYFILGCNFGPYSSQSYYKKYLKIFKEAKDVSFRDSASFNLFKELKNVRYNPDIVFSLGLNNTNHSNSTTKTAIISVIDCSKHKFSKVTEKYENKVLEIANKLIQLGYSIILFSFCKAEGDELAIDRIYKKIENSKLKYVNKHSYNGNVEDSLSIIRDSDLVVGTRFHSIVLALSFKKPVIPISYSIKTKNMLTDLKFKNEIIDIEKINEFDVDSINYEMLNYICDTDISVSQSLKHFEVLDKYLRKEV